MNHCDDDQFEGLLVNDPFHNGSDDSGSDNPQATKCSTALAVIRSAQEGLSKPDWRKWEIVLSAMLAQGLGGAVGAHTLLKERLQLSIGPASEAFVLVFTFLFCELGKAFLLETFYRYSHADYSDHLGQMGLKDVNPLNPKHIHQGWPSFWNKLALPGYIPFYYRKPGDDNWKVVPEWIGKTMYYMMNISILSTASMFSFLTVYFFIKITPGILSLPDQWKYPSLLFILLSVPRSGWASMQMNLGSYKFMRGQYAGIICRTIINPQSYLEQQRIVDFVLYRIMDIRAQANSQNRSLLYKKLKDDINGLVQETYRHYAGRACISFSGRHELNYIFNGSLKSTSLAKSHSCRLSIGKRVALRLAVILLSMLGLANMVFLGRMTVSELHHMLIAQDPVLSTALTALFGLFLAPGSMISLIGYHCTPNTDMSHLGTMPDCEKASLYFLDLMVAMGVFIGTFILVVCSTRYIDNTLDQLQDPMICTKNRCLSFMRFIAVLGGLTVGGLPNLVPQLDSAQSSKYFLGFCALFAVDVLEVNVMLQKTSPIKLICLDDREEENEIITIANQWRNIHQAKKGLFMTAGQHESFMQDNRGSFAPNGRSCN